MTEALFSGKSVQNSNGGSMRVIRYAVLALVVAAAFTGCKKGGGYMTAPQPAVVK